MSLSLPSRRVTQSASTALAAGRSPSAHVLRHALAGCSLTPSRHPFARGGGGLLSPAAATMQVRFLNWGKFFGLGKKKKPRNASTPWGDKIESAEGRKVLKQQAGSQVPGLPAGSIFAAGDGKRGKGQGKSAKGKTAAAAAPDQETAMGGSLLRDRVARAVDPDPRSRVRWERKMVMRRVHRNLSAYGGESRVERIARTERSHLSKSPPLPTSTKKLVHLAHQIQGKTVEDALVQMRFSKKKMAREVRWQLEEARDTAVVQHGMGLGRHTGELLPVAEAIQICTKDGRHLAVQDPSRLYIEQAWVGRGPIRFRRPIYAARGRMFTAKSPSTYLSLVIKEDKTRVREHQEREAKAARRPPWVHHPNRPVTAQRPWYSW